MKKEAAIFLDRDGTINEEVGYLDSLDKLAIFPSAFEAIRLINQSGLKTIVVTNQAGVARDFFGEDFVETIHAALREALCQRGALIDAFYYCPHHPTEGFPPYRQSCDCRKPAPGLFLRAAMDWNLDLSASWMIGDRYNDIEAAHRAGARGVLVKTGYGADALAGAGPDGETLAGKPDLIADDILQAVHLILGSRK
ncbi:MAG: HAD family hydrolase [Smithellaceae bacterium]|jgi:D-glycero-D-manno-heptose 1,7-bisphosphate phosphatase|nr:HAD family hydrolase [Desulfobacterales bacterium]MDD3082658.1 HAD family hydrolase [Desulfobacterales bacterium]MDD3847957.1 HAD family hydrolase [Smithellaceae bacterium]HOG12702.1 HAD family hydrolase [Smithellaceae bacterium]HPL10569.1 HAD family hydrolase [Smithellaceae bacterium]